MRISSEIEIVGVRGPVSGDFVSVKIISRYLATQTRLYTRFIPRKRGKPQNIVAIDEKKVASEKISETTFTDFFIILI